MHPALRKLILLRLRASVRSWLRGLRTWKGALFSVIGTLVMGAWIVPHLFSANRFGGATPMPAGSTGELRTAIPFVMLAFCVLSLFTSRTQGAFPFVPAEVLFLFAGPFTRRQMLAYKMATGLVSGTITALIFSVIFSEFFPTWRTAYVGCFLTWLFLYLVPKAVFLLKQSVAERAYTRGRKLLVAGVVALGMLGFTQGALTARSVGLWEFLEAVRQSWPGTILLVPFEVFARMLLSEEIVPGFLVWASTAAVLNLGLVGLIFYLDANYLAAAEEHTRRNYERLQKVRRGGLLTTTIKSAKAGAWIRPLPWLGGAGPIAWQQLVTAVRTAGRALAGLLVVFGCLASVLVVSGIDSEGLLVAVGAVFAYSLVFMTLLLRFDFRGSLERIEVLKTLPLRPLSATYGQLAAPVLIASGLHIALLLGAAPFVAEDRWAIPVCIAFVVPFNLAFFGIENLVFLLFPTSAAWMNAGGFQNMGRGIVMLFMRMALLTAILGPAAALGGLAYWLSGGSWLVAFVVAWHLVALGAIALVPFVAWAYERFDPSVDMPA